MRRRSERPNDRRAAAVAFGLLVLVVAGCSGNRPAPGIDEQMRFGVQMAQRGLWNEALFRFEKARAAEPSNPRVLNNIAVSLEAAGRYEEALEAYREALRIAPGNRQLEANYARFVDFYQTFQTPEVPVVTEEPSE